MNHYKRWVAIALFGLGLGLGGGPKATSAAETIRFKLGPLQQSIQVSELETFATTGKLPAHLQFYRFFLDDNIQGFLQRSLQLDPETTEQFFDQLWRSPMGTQILDQVQTALPETSIDDLKASVNGVLAQDIEISALNLLRAYPKEELTIDLSAVAGMLLQVNVPNLQNQLLTPQVTSALEASEAESFQPLSVDPTESGVLSVRRQSLILDDKRRDRTIAIDIFDSHQPQDQLVVMSHGFAANRHFLDYLGIHLASHGYTVVTLEHPGSNIQSLLEPGLNLERLLPASEFIDRPKDVQFVLDQLADLSENGPLNTIFATDNVTLIGHSFGGYTALALAGGIVDPVALREHCRVTNPLTHAPGDWLQCAAARLPYDQLDLRDERIKQAIALNPVSDQLFGDDGLAAIDIPTLIVASTEDAITPSLSHQLRPFQQISGEKYLLVAAGATHMSVTDAGNQDSLVAQNTLVPEVMGDAAAPMRQVLQGISLSFLARHQPAGQAYQQFLTGSYVQSLSAGDLDFRLTDIISPELERFLSGLVQSTESTAAAPRLETQQARLLPWGQSPQVETKSRYPQGDLALMFQPLMGNLNPMALASSFNVAYQGPGRPYQKR